MGRASLSDVVSGAHLKEEPTNTKEEGGGNEGESVCLSRTSLLVIGTNKVVHMEDKR